MSRAIKPSTIAKAWSRPAARLSYDPDEVFASVYSWICRLAIRRARRFGRPDLADDLTGELATLVLAKLRDGTYDPARSMPTTFVGVVARSNLRRIVDRLLDPIHVPSHALTLASTDEETARVVATAKRGRLAIGWSRDDGDRPEVDPVDHRPGPDAEAERAEHRAEAERLLNALARINALDAHILAAHFGLDGGEPAGNQEIARRLGISSETAWRRRTRIIHRLRRAVADEGSGIHASPVSDTDLIRHARRLHKALGRGPTALELGEAVGLHPVHASERRRVLARQGRYPAPIPGPHARRQRPIDP